MLPRHTSDLTFYNRHPNVLIRGPQSMAITNSQGTFNLMRSQVQSIVNDNVVLSEVGATGIYPSGFVESFGAADLIKVFNRSPHFEFDFVTHSDGIIHVPKNRLPTLDDLLPPKPVKVKPQEVDLARSAKRDSVALDALMELREKQEKGRIFAQGQRKIKKDIMNDIDERRIMAHKLLGKDTTINPRRPGPYPLSTIPESRRDKTKTRKGKAPALNAKATPFVPAAPAAPAAPAQSSHASGSDDTLDNYRVPDSPADDDDTEMAAPPPAV